MTLQLAIYDLMTVLLRENGWECRSSTVNDIGVAVVWARSTRGERDRMFTGATVAEACARMMMELTGLVPEQRSDRLDANRVARHRLGNAIRKLLPADEEEL